MADEELKPVDPEVVTEKPTTSSLTVATIAIVAALIGGGGAYLAKPEGTIKPTVETTLTAKEITAHKDTIQAVRDTSGKITEAAKVVDVPRKVEWPVVNVPSKGWVVLDADNYKPVTVVITQGDVIIKKVVDIDLALLREAGNAALNIQINTIPLNGTKTRGVDSLKNEDL